MADPTAFALSKMFTQLTGRQVGFTLVLKAPPSKKSLYGDYRIVPGNAALVVRADMELVGLFGGALLGLPKDTVLERVKKTPLEEVLRDAMYEVLNIASTVISVDHRAVFQNFYTDPVYLASEAQDVLRAPFHTAQFEVAMDGCAKGDFAVISGG